MKTLATIRLAIATVALLAVLSITALPGCGSLASAQAETLEQKAAAALGDFTVYQKASVTIGEDETVSVPVRKAVLDAVIAAKPVADKVDAALREYRKIAAQLATGETTDQKMAVVAANLRQWVTDLAPLIKSLRTNVETASP